MGVPLGVPPPYDGIRAQASGRGGGGVGGVGVPPPYDGIRAQASGRGGGGRCHSDGDADDLSSHTREEKYFNFLQFGAFLSYDDFFVFVM